MTKRILAIVLAVVMAMSVLMVEAFAFDYMTGLTATVNGNTITVSGYGVSGASSYRITVKCGSATVYNSIVTATTQNITSSYSGSHTVDVDAYTGANGSGDRIGSGSTKCNVEKSTTVSGITVTSSGSDVKVSWTSKSYVNTYYVSWSGSKSGNASVSNSGTSCSYTITGVTYDQLSSVSVYEGNANGTCVGTWTPSGSSWGGGSSGNQSSGGVYVSGTTLYFPATIGYSYTISVTDYNGRTAAQSQTITARSSTESIDFSGLTSSNTYLRFTVYCNNTRTTIGYATYGYNGYPGYGSSNGDVWLDGTTVRWYGQGIQNYRIVISASNYGQILNTTTSSTYYNFSVLAGRYPYSTLTITITATYTGNTLGTVYYYPGYSGSYPGYGNGTTTNYNINVTTLNGRATISWNSVAYSSTYRVTYKYLNTSAASNFFDTSSLSATIDISSGGVYIEVAYLYNGRYYTMGSATVSPNGNGGYSVSYNNDSNTGSSNNNSSYGCTLTVGSTSSTVSWNSYYGATFYQVIYSYYDLNGNLKTNSAMYIYQTSYSFPVGTSNATNSLQVQIIAYNNGGVLGNGPFATATKTITTSSNNNTTTKPADTTPEAPTNFKGTATNKKVLLSWDKAKNADSYKVYWKRSSSSDWKLAKETTKRALTVSGLNNDMSYDFRVVANGHESGILTISPTASGSNVKTAPDPKGSTSSNKVPVITSATGGTRSLTVAWDGVTGGNLYKVYTHQVGVDAAADGGSIYYPKATVTTTSATITGISSGTYQIRIKASTDNGKTWTSLSDCEPYTVTVK